MSVVSHLQAAVHITGPITLILCCGVLFKRLNWIDDHFLAVANRLVFNVCLPGLLFLSVAKGVEAEPTHFALVAFAACATVLSVMAISVLSTLLRERSKRGVFAQCAFRGNMAIMGLALCVNAFGEGVISLAAMYLAFITVLYNVLSVILLTRPGLTLVKNIATNPLILSIVAGGLVSYFNLRLPTLLDSSIDYLAKITLPMALLCIGGGLRWQSFRANGFEVLSATVIKLLIQPALITSVAIYWGFRGEELGVLFLMLSVPTAAAAYVMSKQMSGHGALAGEIVTLSTLLSPVTTTLGIMTLAYFNFI